MGVMYMLDQTLVDRLMIRELVALSEPDYQFFNEMIELFIEKLSEIKQMLRLELSEIKQNQEIQNDF
jgi:hypothetical protein